MLPSLRLFIQPRVVYLPRASLATTPRIKVKKTVITNPGEAKSTIIPGAPPVTLKKSIILTGKDESTVDDKPVELPVSFKNFQFKDKSLLNNDSKKSPPAAKQDKKLDDIEDALANVTSTIAAASTPPEPKSHPSSGFSRSKHAPVDEDDVKAQVSQLKKDNTALKHEVNALQTEKGSLQVKLTQHHSSLETIYGKVGFNQLKNLLQELSGDELQVLRAAGFESDALDHQLELKQKELAIQFTAFACGEVSKHINAYIKRLKDLHKQSTNAFTATQQTLRNAGVPDTVIATTVQSLQGHIDELQNKLSRWEKLKADVDLLLATQ